ncbi:MAG TPA: ABC transporter ATP-binding protein [Bacteroidales bacterium]|nr:ABC transporter ATP-binding protein [Bacteroidales bacterium]
MNKGAVIEISDLTKFYGKARGIEHVNLEIGEGEIFGFIGPNGAGKSTTIRILMNMIFPTSGSAKILGLDVVKESRMIKNHVGYIPSDANAYLSMNVSGFLEYCSRFYGHDGSGKKISELAGLFELDLKRKIADLSLGNRKKVSIIQSLLHSPGILICDEPTTGLDPLMQSVFFDLIREENKKGMTVFFSSHILAEVQLLCKKVAIIREGRIMGVEDIETLRKRQLKKVRIGFIEKADMERFSISGTVELNYIAGNEIYFMFSGDINELVSTLAQFKVVNFTIEEPSLEEIFMHYYKV